ncbi:hypothetical protein ACQKWADRAFT_304528 [Trichoderma austrokoningii]
MPRSTNSPSGSIEETKYSFMEIEHEDHTNASKHSKVHDDIAQLKRAVDALQIQVGQLSDERKLLKDDYDRLKRDNQRRIWEIAKLQDDHREMKKTCEQLRQENLTLKTKSSEFRVAINKLQATVSDHVSFLPHLHELLVKLKNRY